MTSITQNDLSRFGVLLTLGVIALVAFLTQQFLAYTQDDVFITYAYSRNLIEGNGFVFNPGEQVQGTTTPLWTLVIAAVYTLTQNLLVAGNLLSGALLLAVIALANRLMRATLTPLARVVMSVLLATAPIFYISFGMETLLYCTLLLGALVLWQQDRRTLALIVAGLLVWTRADGMVLAGTFGLLLLADIVQQRTADSARRFALGALTGFLTVAPWFTFAYLYFGALTPNTLSAKVIGQSGGTLTNFTQEGIRLLSGHHPPLHWVIIPLMVVGVAMALRNTALRPAALWTLCYLIGYSILDLTEFWYYTPPFTILLILSVYGGQTAVQALLNALPPLKNALTQRPALRYGSIAAIVALLLIVNVPHALRLNHPPQRTEFYTQVGQWINATTPANSGILLVDLGVVGYHARRHAVDTFALIMTDLYNFSPIYAALKYRQDYAVTTYYPPWYETLQNERFHTVYRPVFQVPLPDDIQFSPAGMYELRVPKTTPATVYQGQPLGLNCVLELPDSAPLPDAITATLATLDGTPRITQQTPPFAGAYPDIRNYTLGAERIHEQQILETGALPVGTYQWGIDCQTTQAEGQVEVLPLDTAPNYHALDAATHQWQDGVGLQGVWIANEGRIFTGGTLNIILQFDGFNPQAPIVGVELHDAHGEKQAEGLLQFPAPLEALEPQSVAVYGEIRLPVEMPAGDYTLIVNRIETTGNWEHLPLRSNGTLEASDALEDSDSDDYLLTLSAPVSVQHWTPAAR